MNQKVTISEVTKYVGKGNGISLKPVPKKCCFFLKPYPLLNPNPRIEKAA
jgi:hypothetical protein